MILSTIVLQLLTANQKPFVMAKKKGGVKLQRKDLVGISKLAGLSISTLTKWNDGSLSLKPETELKIFEATNRYFEQEALKLKRVLQNLSEIEQRIFARKRGVKLEIQEIKKKAD